MSGGTGQFCHHRLLSITPAAECRHWSNRGIHGANRGITAQIQCAIIFSWLYNWINVAVVQPVAWLQLAASLVASGLAGATLLTYAMQTITLVLATDRGA
jgi:hypothetical protein